METEAKAKMASRKADREQLRFPQSCTSTKHCTLLICAAIRKSTCMYHVFKFQGDWHKVWGELLHMWGCMHALELKEYPVNAGN